MIKLSCAKLQLKKLLNKYFFNLINDLYQFCQKTQKNGYQNPHCYETQSVIFKM